MNRSTHGRPFLSVTSRIATWTLIANCNDDVWCADHAPVAHRGSFGGVPT